MFIRLSTDTWRGQGAIEVSNSELTTIFCDLEFLLQAKVSSDHDLASKAYAEFFDYHGFTQRLPRWIFSSTFRSLSTGLNVLAL